MYALCQVLSVNALQNLSLSNDSINRYVILRLIQAMRSRDSLDKGESPVDHFLTSMLSSLHDLYAIKLRSFSVLNSRHEEESW